MKIAIIGKAKTGTTAIHAAIAGSAPGPQRVLFEPKTPDEIRPALAQGEPVTAKIIFEHWKQRLPELADLLEGRDPAAFDKIVFIKRDPRDEIVSRMLYFVFPLMQQGGIREEQIKRWRDVLYAKDKNCDITFRNICKQFYEIFGIDIEKNVLNHAIEDTRTYQNFIKSIHQQYFMISYEAFIDDNLGDISSYLEFHVQKYDVNPEYAQVRRTAGYGDWKRMMTPSDIEFFKGMAGNALKEFGYENWDTTDSPETKTSYADYVDRIVGSQL